MGGGRSSSFGGGGDGVGNINVTSATSLISAREGKRSEVDQTLGVMRDVEEQYGITINDAQVVKISGKGARVMAYYDYDGNLAINDSYFNSQKMNEAYDRCVDNGYHPPRGNKTGTEAVVAHELGHRLTHVAGERTGVSLDRCADDIVRRASKAMGEKSIKAFRGKISGYGKQSNAEAVAEAFADVYCNGRRAKRESREVVNVLNSYYGR